MEPVPPPPPFAPWSDNILTSAGDEGGVKWLFGTTVWGCGMFVV